VSGSGRTTVAEDPRRHVHEALFFSSTEDLVAAAAPFLRRGLAAGDDAVLLCTDDNNHAVTEALDGDDRLIYLPRPQVYEKAVTAIEQYRDFMDRRIREGTRRVRLIGQVGFGADSRGWDESQRFEALCNHAMAGYPLWSLCAYDTGLLPEGRLSSVELTHPYVRRAGMPSPNPLYADPAEVLVESHDEPDPLPDVEPMGTLREAGDLRPLARELEDLLRAEQVAGEKVDDFVLAVNEIATNGLRHGRPPVVARLWVDRERMVCAVTDHGPGIDDPFAGYLPGGGDALPEGRFGLWLARRLCDNLLTYRTAEGFTVRLVMHR
jgi:anti-sigma regulatory factor (Ser/Thr protein kinase)